jgi:hypothetical protein
MRSSFHVAELAEPAPQRLHTRVFLGPRPRHEYADARGLHYLLSPSGERQGEDLGQRGQQEAAAVHYGRVTRLTAEVNPHATLRSSGARWRVVGAVFDDQTTSACCCLRVSTDPTERSP